MPDEIPAAAKAPEIAEPPPAPKPSKPAPKPAPKPAAAEPPAAPPRARSFGELAAREIDEYFGFKD